MVLVALLHMYGDFPGVTSKIWQLELVSTNIKHTLLIPYFTVGFVSNFKKSSTSFVVFVDIIFLEITFLHGDLGNTSLQKKKSYMESGAYVQYFEIVTLAIVTFAIEGEKIKPFKIRIYDLQINSHTYINSLC